MTSRLALRLLGLALLAMLGAVVSFVSLDRVLYDGVVSLVLPEDTEFASGYDESRFRELPLPSVVSTVVEQLGQPIARISMGAGFESWVYSRRPTDTHYRVRIIVVRNGQAVEKKHEFYVD